MAAVAGTIADAAATAVANACFVEDKGIIQLPAENIDPNSDLAGINVTTEVAPLSAESIRMAVGNARHKAENLFQKGLIIGAFIALGSVYSMTDGLKSYTRQA
jgi:ApbE superfamily uncharacterized protein (UPF0280 family)